MDRDNFLKFLLDERRKRDYDKSDAEQVKWRIRDYFDCCKEYDVLPHVPGLAYWLCVSRETLREWQSGEYKEIINNALIEIEDLLSVITMRIRYEY